MWGQNKTSIKDLFVRKIKYIDQNKNFKMKILALFNKVSDDNYRKP